MLRFAEMTLVAECAQNSCLEKFTGLHLSGERRQKRRLFPRQIEVFIIEHRFSPFQ
jgi:hypothetical protein